MTNAHLTVHRPTFDFCRHCGAAYCIDRDPSGRIGACCRALQEDLDREAACEEWERENGGSIWDDAVFAATCEAIFSRTNPTYDDECALLEADGFVGGCE